jgi:hypothetical protein
MAASATSVKEQNVLKRCCNSLNVRPQRKFQENPETRVGPEDKKKVPALQAHNITQTKN